MMSAPRAVAQHNAKSKKALQAVIRQIKEKLGNGQTNFTMNLARLSKADQTGFFAIASKNGFTIKDLSVNSGKPTVKVVGKA